MKTPYHSGVQYRFGSWWCCAAGLAGGLAGCGGAGGGEAKPATGQVETVQVDKKAAEARAGARSAEGAGNSMLEKVDSNLVLAWKKSRGEAPFDRPTTLQPSVVAEADGRLLVDLDATVTSELLAAIQQVGGTVIASFAQARAVRALVPLAALEALARRPEIKFINPAAQAMNNRIEAPLPQPPAGISPKS